MLLTTLSLLTWVSGVLWLIVALLPWRPWAVREVFEANPGASAADGAFDEVTIVIPARNEAEQIGATLAAIARQGGRPRVVLVDDQSADGTAEVAAGISGIDLRIVGAEPLPPGWSGKLWALHQGLAQVDTPYALLLDADISIVPGTLQALLDKRRQSGVALLSVMARLRMDGFWEKLLMPAFIHYFKLLYPFDLANSANPRHAAAAGGCILIETSALRAIGGIEAIRGELIDDCALAAAVKRGGFRTWIGLSEAVESQRPYRTLGSIWDMVARTAYTELRYSPVRLAICTLLLLTMYWVPFLAIAAPATFQLPAIVAAALMFFTYLPILAFYRRDPAWTLAQPLIASLFLAMTWSSAVRYWRGSRSTWKGRVYQR